MIQWFRGLRESLLASAFIRVRQLQLRLQVYLHESASVQN